MNLWMRWVNFQALREILLLIEATPAMLRAADLIRLATEERILVDRNGRPLGPSSHYHHRRTLERLGLVVKRDGRYSPNNELPETNALTRDTAFGRELYVGEKEAFSNVILRNHDCRDVFFKYFVQSEAIIEDVNDFIALAQPIEMNVVQRRADSRQRSPRKVLRTSDTIEDLRQVAMRTRDNLDWCALSGTNAVQAIHFGLKSWCVDQLGFLDIMYRADGIYTIYPKRLDQLLPTHELASRMLDLLGLEGEWTTVRVGDFALAVGIKQRVSVEQAKSILASWMNNYPDVVAEIPTSERFIAGGLSKGQRGMVLKNFLLGRGGAYVSHLRIHHSLIQRIQQGVSDHDYNRRSTTEVRP